MSRPARGGPDFGPPPLPNDVSESTVKWFGEPWPSSELRAPVCENDEDRIDFPAGEHCIYCGQMFVAGDFGVRIPFYDGQTTSSIYYHAPHFLAVVVGDHMAEQIVQAWQRQLGS